jgi:acyl-CoA synthetase (AMP-forming)/AMP-acid ligase II
VHESAIEAYLMLDQGTELPAVESQIATRLAAYKRPRLLHIVGQLPRTATGKLVRDRTVLRDVAPATAHHAKGTADHVQ